MGKCAEIENKQLKDFKALTPEAKSELLQSSESIVLDKGKLVFRENQHLNKLYCIKNGACKFSKVDNNGQEHIVRFLGRGEVMGKRSVVSDSGAKVSATTLTNTELCCLDKKEIQKNLKENPKFCQDFLDSLIEDANINEYTRIIFCVNKGIKQRLAQLLLYIYEKYGINSQGGLKLKLKREDMGAVLGTSPEYIINLLKNFKDLGLINIIKREIFITSKSGLEGITV